MDLQDAIDRCAKEGGNFFLRGVAEVSPSVEVRPGVRVRLDEQARGVWIEPKPSAFRAHDLDELELRARAATQGDWRVNKADNIRITTKDGLSVCGCHRRNGSEDQAIANADFIAAVGPLKIQSLVMRVRQLEALLREVKALSAIDAVMAAPFTSNADEAALATHYGEAYERLITLAEAIEAPGEPGRREA